MQMPDNAREARLISKHFHGDPMYSRFGLTLMVNHACNLRCTYCYTGQKFRRAMTWQIVETAIDRALKSLTRGGRLELGFFGGEPLIEAELIEQAIEYACRKTAALGADLTCSLTTNGTIDSDAAWRVLLHPKMRPAVSHDGLPAIHNFHRRTIENRTSSTQVEATLLRLIENNSDCRVVTVVRPDTLISLAEGLVYLHDLGVRHFDLSLDLWTTWTRDDARRLSHVITACAELWAQWLPTVAINWFDLRAAQLAQTPTDRMARCSFGDGEIAIAPSGNLYPCERLIGEDRQENPMRLAGHALDGEDFLQMHRTTAKNAPECDACSLRQVCSTTCRCSNYVRTGDATRPDGLLCWLDQSCFRETARALAQQSLVTCGG